MAINWFAAGLCLSGALWTTRPWHTAMLVAVGLANGVMGFLT